MRMLMNNLDPDVAERPDDLVVYGGSGKAARNWESFDAIVRSLQALEHDETLLVQSGKPVGIFHTHPGAPRVLIANALLVPAWATWENFRDLEQRGLTMYGQMTAGSWIYIGSQGIVQGTYETLAEVARRHFGGTLSGRLVVTAGLGGMGGAQPLAATMNGAAALVIEVDPQRIARRLATRYLDETTDSLDEALDRVGRWTRDRRGAIDRPARQRRRRAAGARRARRHARRADRSDVGARRAERLRAERPVARRGEPAARAEPAGVHRAIDGGDGRPRARDARAQGARRGHLRLRQQHPRAGEAGRRRRTPSTSRASCPSTSARSSARARGRSAGRRSPAIRRTSASPTRPRSRCSRTTRRWCAGFTSRASASRSRGCRRASCGSATASARASGCASTSSCAKGRIKAPIVIGRDHLDAGSVASPNRETEGMLDGSDAIADWPVLNALLNASSGATWVSVHHGGGVGIGYSLHAGMVIVADGTTDADEKARTRADLRSGHRRGAPRRRRVSRGDCHRRTRRRANSDA